VLTKEERSMTKRLWLWFLVIVLTSIPFLTFAQDKEAMVHEAWFVHMESAGGWVAMDKGFYGKVKVKEVQGGPGISPIQKAVAAVRGGSIAFEGGEALPSGMTIRKISSGPVKKKGLI